MKRILTVLILLSSAGAARAVPVVPNFTQGSMTSNTTTTSTVTETINSMDYNTGYQYVVTGTNIETDAANIAPSGNTNTSITLNGVTSQWTGLDMTTRPEFEMTTPGAAFQFTESYQAPGLSNHTIIQRTTTINSVTETTSVFTQ
jgi:hypothetical protein